MPDSSIKICKRALHIPQKSPTYPAKEPFISSAKEPCIISAKEPYISAQEPYIPAQEPYIVHEDMA